MNALSENTYLFAEVDGKYGVFTLKELYELHNQGHKIRVLALFDEKGNKTWIDVVNIVSFGKQPLKRLSLSSTRLFVELSEDAIIPAYCSLLFSGKEEKINLKFNFVNGLKVKQDPRYNDTLLLSTRVPLNIPDGDQKDYDYGFALGFWLAEGWLEKRKHKNTKHSLAKLTAVARKKGMTLEEYLNHTTDIQRVALAIGQTDFERGYVDIVQKHFKFAKPYKVKNTNGYQLYSSDLSLIRLIKEYTEGHTSHDKHLKNEVYNRSWKFLEGIMNGYLAGDAHYRNDADFFRVNMTANYRLYNDLIFIAKALGYDIHLQNDSFEKSPFPSYEKVYHFLRLSIFMHWHRHSAFGLVKEHIKSIEDVGEREAFNLVLKPLYPENDKRAKFNHLFFTAYGFLVSDAVKTLDRSVSKTSLPVPVSE